MVSNALYGFQIYFPAHKLINWVQRWGRAGCSDLEGMSDPPSPAPSYFFLFVALIPISFGSCGDIHTEPGLYNAVGDYGRPPDPSTWQELYFLPFFSPFKIVCYSLCLNFLFRIWGPLTGRCLKWIVWKNCREKKVGRKFSREHFITHLKFL